MARFILIFLCSWMVHIPSFSQHILPVGKPIYYEVVAGSTLGTGGTERSVYRLIGKGVNEAGFQKIECTLLAHEVGSFEDNVFTSNGSWDIHNSDLLKKILLLNEPFSILMNQNGHTDTSSKTVFPILEAKAQKLDVDQKIISFWNHFDGLYLGQFPHLAFSFLPEMRQGLESWETRDGNGKVSLTHTINGIRSYEETTDVSDSLGNSYQSTTVLEFSPKTELIRKVEHFFKSENPASGMAPVHSRITVRWLDEPSVTRLPDAAIAARIQSSFFSRALKKTVGYDAEKIDSFLAENDSLLWGYQGYRVQRLGLLQSADTEKPHAAYQKALKDIPIAWLKGYQHHVHNRLSDEVDRNADSALALLHIRDLSPDSDQWIQHSFAQRFMSFEPYMDEMRAEAKKQGVPESEIDSVMAELPKRVANGHKLLRKIQADTSAALRNSMYPMFLWQQVVLGAHSDSIRLAFSKMNEQEINAGNAFRYELLVYKEWMKSGKTEAASQLMRQMTPRMEAMARDENNRNHRSYKNMLAHAFFLQSEAEKDSVKSLALLEKASRYSPSSKEDLTHDSFYDRALLASKESYRSDYASRLLGSGNKVGAFAALSENVNADPQTLGELEKVFREKMPDQNFGNFFRDVVMKTWQQAPDFNLKSPDGKIHRLKDYRGKWVLIDFWGTWCQPCRKEMPELNAYAKSIEGSTSEAFVSIACGSAEKEVVDYFAENNFVIPVAMSDNKVEKNYDVKGYPSKYIVSPEGKMMSLQFGADFRSILNAFRKAYDAAEEKKGESGFESGKKG